jgi:hypothetical protein
MVKKGHLGFAGDGFCQQRLTGTRGAHHQYAAGNLSAQTLEFARIPKKFHQFANLVLGFLDPGHVGEGHLHLVLTHHPGSALAEGHGPSTARAALHLAQKENPNTDQQQHREPTDEDLHQQRLFFRRGTLDIHTMVEQLANHRAVIGFRAIRGKFLPRAGASLNGAPIDGNMGDVSLPRIFQKLGISHLGGRDGSRSKAIEYRHQNNRDDDP